MKAPRDAGCDNGAVKIPVSVSLTNNWGILKSWKEVNTSKTNTLRLDSYGVPVKSPLERY